MSDYSKLSYQELCRIANDDAIAQSMSEEEYERLSRELWKKFRIEKRVTAIGADLSERELGLRTLGDTIGNAPLAKQIAATK
jgi:hypothetical protein